MEHRVFCYYFCRSGQLLWLLLLLWRCILLVLSSHSGHVIGQIGETIRESAIQNALTADIKHNLKNDIGYESYETDLHDDLLDNLFLLFA